MMLMMCLLKICLSKRMSVPQQKLKICKSKSNKPNNFTHQKIYEKGHQIKLQYFEFNLRLFMNSLFIQGFSNKIFIKYLLGLINYDTYINHSLTHSLNPLSLYVWGWYIANKKGLKAISKIKQFYGKNNSLLNVLLNQLQKLLNYYRLMMNPLTHLDNNTQFKD